MRYLKYFESNKLYHQITFATRDEIDSLDVPWVRFTHHEKIIIKDILDRKVEEQKVKSWELRENNIHDMYIVHDLVHNVPMNIVRFEDDWFHCWSGVNSPDYKCDQLDGLVQFLNERLS